LTFIEEVNARKGPFMPLLQGTGFSTDNEGGIERRASQERNFEEGFSSLDGFLTMEHVKIDGVAKSRDLEICL
jgi:hypothetical protein